ncbi:MAG TPA: plastocyanin/azurin family copper-binding protein [Gemmatimonadaceae bacterium]|nr:plastocyanin/azurin family copper-binding protein [Gemmatimonadaceae bacterium]
MIAGLHFARRLALGSAVATLVACGGGGEPATHQMPAGQPAAAPASGGPLTPVPGGEVIKIDMITDEQGNNRFVPAEFEAHVGDVLRFTLVTGVHNVHFVADSNRSASPLPPASPLLQLPGQTWDIAVGFAPGRYYFQCDPHALLGMIGHVKVEDRD